MLAGISGLRDNWTDCGALVPLQLEAVTPNVPDTNPDWKERTICGVPWPDLIVVLAGITQL